MIAVINALAICTWFYWVVWSILHYFRRPRSANEFIDVGSIVTHPRHGQMRVVSIQGDTLVLAFHPQHLVWAPVVEARRSDVAYVPI